MEYAYGVTPAIGGTPENRRVPDLSFSIRIVLRGRPEIGLRHALLRFNKSSGRHLDENVMKLLYVHDRFGSLAGAEANALITATEFKARGHTLGILHGTTTKKGESAWTETFPWRFPLCEANRNAVEEALSHFQPDVV